VAGSQPMSSRLSVSASQLWPNHSGKRSPLADGAEHFFLVARGRQVDVQDQAAGGLGAGQQLVDGAVRQVVHARGGGIGEQGFVVGGAHR
jgi:hypothetical protein